MHCAACGGKTSERELSGVRIDCCSGCGGVWFDRGELEASIQAHAARYKRARGAAPPPRAPVEEESSLDCPRCDGSQLTAIAAHGIAIRICPGCGGAFVSRQAFAAILARHGGGSGGEAAQASLLGETISGAKKGAEMGLDIVLEFVAAAVLDLW